MCVYYIKKWGYFMSVCKFDTFENEKEISKMIKSLQDRSHEYLQLKDPWDIVATNPIVASES